MCAVAAVSFPYSTGRRATWLTCANLCGSSQTVSKNYRQFMIMNLLVCWFHSCKSCCLVRSPQIVIPLLQPHISKLEEQLWSRGGARARPPPIAGGYARVKLQVKLQDSKNFCRRYKGWLVLIIVFLIQLDFTPEFDKLLIMQKKYWKNLVTIFVIDMITPFAN